MVVSVAGCGTDGNEGSGPTTTTAAPPQVTRSNLPYDDTPDVPPADEKRFIFGTNGFGLELFRRVSAASDKNVVVSPLSLSVALSMAYAGAAGDTAAEMKTVLRDSFGNETYYRAMNQLLIDLRSRNRGPISNDDPRSIELSLVDAAFLARDLTLRAPFLDILSTQFDAGVHLADFEHNPEGERININNFANEATKGLIKDLIPKDPPMIDKYTRAVLVNASYLKASWDDLFDPKNTADSTFRIAPASPVTVPMMHDPVRWTGYFAGPDFQAVTLPYVGGDLRMLVIVPTEGKLQAVRNGMDEAWVNNVIGSLADTYVDFSMPRFRVTWGTEILNQTLSDMGMPAAFDDQRTDFSNMSNEDLKISTVLQKAYVGIDEFGTEAAAASAVIGGGTGPPPLTVTVTVDHPFVFAIVDKTGAVFFIGQVMDPR